MRQDKEAQAMPEHIGTEVQGKYTYSIFVDKIGDRWGWQVSRRSTIEGQLARFSPPLIKPDGYAPSKEEAITAARQACQKAMEENRQFDLD
jgi:hypothetical protein